MGVLLDLKLKKNESLTASINVLFQESYNFWTCSYYLPLYLRHPFSAIPVTVKPCQSVCKEVEKTCPFLIKGPDDDKAAGNPSFICKGECKDSIKA